MKVALGIGCDRGTPLATLVSAVDEALALAGLMHAQVKGVGSITLKSDEPGLLALAAQAGWPLHFYPAAQLAEVQVPNPSETVRRHTGTPSVAEAAALLAAGTADAQALCVEKHRRRGADGRSATVSVARVMPRLALAAVAVDSDPALHFTAGERAALQSLPGMGRDAPHFDAGGWVGDEVRSRLVPALLAVSAPGELQPWRVLRLTDPALRACLIAAVDATWDRAAPASGAPVDEDRSLHRAWLRECAELWVLVGAAQVAAPPARGSPENDPTAWLTGGPLEMAVHQLGLIARAGNLGLVWVTAFDAVELSRLLALPDGTVPLGLACIDLLECAHPARIPLPCPQAQMASASTQGQVWDPLWRDLGSLIAQPTTADGPSLAPDCPGLPVERLSQGMK